VLLEEMELQNKDSNLFKVSNDKYSDEDSSDDFNQKLKHKKNEDVYNRKLKYRKISFDDDDDDEYEIYIPPDLSNFINAVHETGKSELATDTISK
jgi:uncharacterized protein YpmB